MPMYEYRCTKCAHKFEELVRLNTPDSEIPCPQCSEHHAKRLISSFSTASSKRGLAAPSRGFS